MAHSSRNRSLGGCGTCRVRHTKCDETRPVCTTCLSSQLTCTGYGIRLQFVHQEETGSAVMENGASQFRRPLFTESEREELNTSIIRSFGDVDPGQALVHLDERTAMAKSCDYPMSLGPFGVFELQKPGSQTQVEIDIDSAVGLPSQTLDLTDFVLPLLGDNGDLIIPPISSSAGDGELDDSTVLGNESMPLEDTLALQSIGPQSTLNQCCDVTHDTASIYGVEGPLPSSTLYHSIPLGMRLPEDTWALLANYRQRVIPILTPLGSSQKSPWHHLMLPCAMNAMAEISMGGSTSYARSALLYTLITTSARQVELSSSTPPTVDIWTSAVQFYKQRARHDLKCCLQMEASSHEKKAKYKEILMALISMAILNIFDGDADSLMACLIITEGYIGRRGLSKSCLSRKARCLHHCYAYLRIFNETILLSDMSADRSRDLGVDLDPSVTSKASRFRISRWSDTPDFALATVKSMEMGQYDLHLEYPGRWDLTMYYEIFGIPESFLNLVSHVTRLGNERDLLMDDDSGGAHPSTRELFLRAKLVEEHILRWGSAQDIRTPRDRLPILLVMQKALLIFFYRRFHDMEPVTLQSEVRDIRNLLVQSSKTFHQSVYMIWPGFIAACEALDDELQDYFRHWFDDCFRSTRIPSSKEAYSVVESIWKSRENEDRKSLQWPDVLRSSKQRFIIF